MTTVFAIMDEICAWLKANKICPKQVPIDEVPEVAGGKITVHVYALSAQGQRYVNDRRQIAREVITVPLLDEPPAALRPWLAGEVPAIRPLSADAVRKLRVAFPGGSPSGSGEPVCRSGGGP